MLACGKDGKMHFFSMSSDQHGQLAKPSSFSENACGDLHYTTDKEIWDVIDFIGRTVFCFSILGG
jgi:hypothetical protein